jgi:hypothetical protein
VAQVHVRSLDVNLGQLSPHLHAVEPYLFCVRFLPSIMGLLNMEIRGQTGRSPVPSLPRLPPPRISPAVEAGNHHNPLLLNLEEDSIGKTPHSRAATVPVDDRELQCIFCDRFDCGLDCQREAFPKFVTNPVIPRPRFEQILIRLA